jgi:hypothetical protein
MVRSRLVVSDFRKNAPDCIIAIPEMVFQCRNDMQRHQQCEADNA